MQKKRSFTGVGKGEGKKEREEIGAQTFVAIERLPRGGARIPRAQGRYIGNACARWFEDTKDTPVKDETIQHYVQWTGRKVERTREESERETARGRALSGRDVACKFAHDDGCTEREDRERERDRKVESEESEKRNTRREESEEDSEERPAARRGRAEALARGGGGGGTKGNDESRAAVVKEKRMRQRYALVYVSVRERERERTGHRV